MSRTTEQWVDFLRARFAGTDYAVSDSCYYGWVNAGVDPDDDEESVADAWREQADEVSL